ncbi:long polar fimbrial protein LpfE [Escherichia marmotae]|uniref:long polar fimbrial protein LpfE n=1 Tax=Escherichia marmotae TaxID=1499973 RepID=UPI0027DFB803|nr:long polar fimbrial protein LpfE [Escherichia marmotae]
MRRNILLVLLPLLALTSCINVEAKTSLGELGKLTFSLAVVAKGCEFESSDLEVDMGKMTLTKPISVGQVLKERNFAISLKDCDGTAKAKVTMDGLPDASDSSLFALDPGGAAGVALKIVDGKGTQQIPKVAGGAEIEWPVTGATSQLDYAASYVVVNANATSGIANALVNFSVEYE